MIAGKIADFSNADVAVDQYHRFDVNLDLPFSRFCLYSREKNVSRAQRIESTNVYGHHPDLFICFCQEDIQLMKDMGMDAYRFSIAWSRIFPSKLFHNLIRQIWKHRSLRALVKSGLSDSVLIRTVTDGSGQINQAGVDHYNKLIDALLAKGSYTMIMVCTHLHRVGC